MSLACSILNSSSAWHLLGRSLFHKSSAVPPPELFHRGQSFQSLKYVFFFSVFPRTMTMRLLFIVLPSTGIPLSYVFSWSTLVTPEFGINGWRLHWSWLLPLGGSRLSSFWSEHIRNWSSPIGRQRLRKEGVEGKSSASHHFMQLPGMDIGQ